VTPEQLKARNDAIREAWEDPLRLALARMKTKPGSKRSSREAYNAYYRNYRKVQKDERSRSESD
jgi:hypothetical protein